MSAATLRGSVLADVDLHAGPRRLFSGLKELGCNSLVHVLFSTIRTDSGWHSFDHERCGTTLERHSGFPWMSLSVFADHALHEGFLCLKSGSHSLRSGSYTVITIAYLRGFGVTFGPRLPVQRR